LLLLLVAVVMVVVGLLAEVGVVLALWSTVE
jgi:hypothetical protein